MCALFLKIHQTLFYLFPTRLRGSCVENHAGFPVLLCTITTRLTQPKRGKWIKIEFLVLKVVFQEDLGFFQMNWFIKFCHI